MNNLIRKTLTNLNSLNIRKHEFAASPQQLRKYCHWRSNETFTKNMKEVTLDDVRQQQQQRKHSKLSTETNPLMEKRRILKSAAYIIESYI